MNTWLALQLPAVQPNAGSSWTLWLVLAAILFVVAAIYLHRRFPSETAKAEAQGKADLAKALGDLRTLVATKLSDSKGPTEEKPAEPAPAPAPAGKNGQPGVLSLAVTGDPAKDLAAFQAAYFGG